MKETSWLCTLITQLSLCMLAYFSINIGQPQKLTHDESRANDMYFITVVGGFRPLEEQTLLLQQMGKVKKTCKARFVVGFSELGASDPLMQNAKMFPELRNMPWYTAGDLDGQGQTYSLKKIKACYGQILDIIALDTSILQDQSSGRGDDEIVWLTKTLNESKSDWKIVVGFHPLTSQVTPFERLNNILQQYGVDVYVSHKMSIRGGALDKDPINHNLISQEDTVEGFLLHRISSLEMVTLEVKVTGEVEQRSWFQQKGRAAM